MQLLDPIFAEFECLLERVLQKKQKHDTFRGATVFTTSNAPEIAWGNITNVRDAQEASDGMS
jgi:hypothetical protein